MRTINRFLRLIVLLLFLAILWSGYVLHLIAETEKTAHPRQADVGIVLGAAVWGDQPSPSLKERLDLAAELYRQGYVPYLIVSGGLGDGKQIDEATVMQRYLVQQGIPAEYILLENQARSTYQNLAYSKEIMEQHQLSTALLISHDYHLARAMDMAASLQIAAYPVGVHSQVMLEWLNKCQEIVSFSKWKLSHFLPISR
ncbi:YdcF family protein [Brevibacillus fulvus]|uniref:Uncharacterized SAM-binding protein YcdF (DUF218 family) n=1 Tax=Brevibacillus fulvus TaxID=1125967 RepID=A0A938Y4B8_9BACL|nr:YdcF family protein [Brevibacillus fulvus]MBM7591711.1 uncharacterized SAM-binding protein YcdF (DUF218 family) [Brevibacillus fulvus]